MLKRPLSRTIFSRCSYLQNAMVTPSRPISIAQLCQPGPLGATRTLYQRPLISAFGQPHYFVKLAPISARSQIQRYYSMSPTSVFRTLTKWQRRASLITAFGGGILLTIFIGPILLVTVGGVAAVFWWRYWRQMRQLRREMDTMTSGNGILQNPLANLGSLFSANQSQLTSTLQQQAIERIREDVESPSSEIVRYLSIDDPLDISFSDVHATSSSRSSTIFNGRHQSTTFVDLEFALSSGSGPKGIARARGSVNGNQVQLEKVSIYWPQWDRETVLPASLNSNSRTRRVIEGEFRDID